MPSTLISSRMRGFLSAACVTLFVLLTCQQGFAIQPIFSTKNFAITPPLGWEKVNDLPKEPAITAFYRNPDKTAMLLITIQEGGTMPRPMSDQVVEDFERGFENSGGGKRLSGHFIDVSGIRAYERIGRLQKDGRDISSVVWLIPDDGVTYQLQAISLDGEANTNPELRKALESFRYLNVPAETYSETAALEKNPAYRMGGVMAKGLIGIVVLLILGKMFSK